MMERIHYRISRQIRLFELPVFTGPQVQEFIDRLLLAHKRDVEEMRRGIFPPEKPPPPGMMFGVKINKEPDIPDNDND